MSRRDIDDTLEVVSDIIEEDPGSIPLAAVCAALALVFLCLIVYAIASV